VISVAAVIMALHYDNVLELNASCLIPFFIWGYRNWFVVFIFCHFVGPSNEIETSAFNNLDKTCSNASSAVRWAITRQQNEG